MGLREALEILRGLQIHSYVKFSEDPHYALKEVQPGVHRWTLIWKEAGGDTKGGDLYPSQDHLGEILEHLNSVKLEGLENPTPIGRGSSGRVWLADHPNLGAVVIKWGGPPLREPGRGLAWKVQRQVRGLFGMELNQFGSAVSELINRLGGATLPTGYAFWDIDQLEREKKHSGIAKDLARYFHESKEILGPYHGHGLVPVSIAPALHTTRGTFRQVDQRELWRLFALESLLGAPDRHRKNYIYIPRADGGKRPHPVGIDYNWVGGTHDWALWQGAPLEGGDEDDYESAIPHILNALGRQTSDNPRGRLGVYDALHLMGRLDEVLKNMRTSSPAFIDRLESFWRVYTSREWPLEREATSALHRGDLEKP